MPAEAALTDRGRMWRDRLPTKLQRSPDHVAVIHSVTKEIERAEEAIEQVRRQLFPHSADLLLGVYEWMLGITVEPEGVSVEDRQQLVLAQLRKLRSSPEGRDWVANVTALVGPGWSYEEHIAGDPGSPPENTILIHLPFPPASTYYAAAERLIRVITPAHLDLTVTFVDGFKLDESQLDQEAVQ